MEEIRISSVQFESRNGDKDYNLSVIDNFSANAAAEGSVAVAFHECCISGYSFARHLSRQQMLDVAERIPDGHSMQKLVEISRKHGIHILAGLFERDDEDRLFNTYLCVNQDGLVAKFRKLHPFISAHLSPGDQYCIFNIRDWKCGILICYDNNIIENVRATAFLGADIIFMPHVTMCTPSTRPGAGFVDPALWRNRESDPTSLRQEFDGPKGRTWLMKWLPARAYDNAVYAVFSNPIGMDDDQLKNGCSMILDPFGDVVAECRALGNDICTATITPEKLTMAGGHRYRSARRPDLYSSILSQSHDPRLSVSWLTDLQS